MAKIKGKKTKAIVYTLCEHFKDLPEHLKPTLQLSYNYCPECGQKLFVEEKVIENVCSDCGKPINKLGNLDILYCAFCGEKFDERND